jgi:hypothetical protein
MKHLDCAHYYRLGWLRSRTKKVPRGGWQLRAFTRGENQRQDYEFQTSETYPTKIKTPCRHRRSERWQCPCPRCYYSITNLVRTLTDRPEIDRCDCETCEATR